MILSVEDMRPLTRDVWDRTQLADVRWEIGEEIELE